MRREREKKTSRLEILLSSQANILHLDQNAAKDLDLHLYSQTLTKNCSASFKTRFSAKFPEVKGLSSQKVSNGKLAFAHAPH